MHKLYTQNKITSACRIPTGTSSNDLIIEDSSTKEDVNEGTVEDVT